MYHTSEYICSHRVQANVMILTKEIDQFNHDIKNSKRKLRLVFFHNCTSLRYSVHENVLLLRFDILLIGVDDEGKKVTPST